MNKVKTSAFCFLNRNIWRLTVR